MPIVSGFVSVGAVAASTGAAAASPVAGASAVASAGASVVAASLLQEHPAIINTAVTATKNLATMGLHCSIIGFKTKRLAYT